MIGSITLNLFCSVDCFYLRSIVGLFTQCRRGFICYSFFCLDAKETKDQEGFEEICAHYFRTTADKFVATCFVTAYSSAALPLHKQLFLKNLRTG